MQPYEYEIDRTCRMCDKPNDVGEICAECAEEHREVTLAGYFDLPIEEQEKLESYQELRDER